MISVPRPRAKAEGPSDESTQFLRAFWLAADRTQSSAGSSCKAAVGCKQQVHNDDP